MKKQVFFTCLSIAAITGCGSSKSELEDQVKFHAALFHGIGDVTTLRVSGLSTLKSGKTEGICGTAFYDLKGNSNNRQSPTRFMLLVSPAKIVLLENDWLSGKNRAFSSDWNESYEKG